MTTLFCKNNFVYKKCINDCSRVYDPVCGRNIVTYKNLYHWLCDGSTIKYIGKCNTTGYVFGDCNNKYHRSTVSPVSGPNNVSYTNNCFATCAVVDIKDDTYCCGDDTCWMYDIIDPEYRITLSNLKRFLLHDYDV